MKTFTHRYLLPPILVSIHALFLLPLLIPISVEPQRPQTPSDSDPIHHDDVSDTLDHVIAPQPLNLGHAIYFGVASFAFVYILKQIAGRIPLPASKNKRKLAIWMELVILFAMGALEEIWRWGVVQYLVNVEMGSAGSEHFGSARQIWKTIYAGGWVWSLVECAFSWWGFRPDGYEEETTPKQQHSPRPTHRTRPRRTFSQQSVPVLNSRKSPPPNRRDSLTALRRGSVLAFPGDENPFMNTLQGRTITWQSGTEGNRSAVSLLSGDASGTVGRTDERADTPLFGENFQFPSPSTRPFSAFVETRFSPQVGEQNAQNGGPPTQDIADLPARHLEDSDFGDDEEDARSVTSFSSITSSLRSSLDTSRSHAGAETPLLSSSLQYDEHHHHHGHESHSLLNNQARRMSYHTMSNGNGGLQPVYSEDDEEDTHITVRDYEYDIEEQAAMQQNNGQNVTFQESDILLHQDQRREYPSFSNQYNSSHFSLQNNDRHNNFESSSSATAIAPRPPPRTSYSEQSYQRLLYGVSVNSLSPVLPIVWRTSALLRHLACTLLFAFFPAIVTSEGKVQWWTVGVVAVVASLKGWYTVEWLGGNVARSGVAKVTIITAVVSIVLFLATLGLWRIL